MESVLKLHADFDDEATMPTSSADPSSSITLSFPGITNGEIPESDGSDISNEAIHVDTLASLAANLTLDVLGESMRMPGTVELESIKQEEDEEDEIFLQLSRTTSDTSAQSGQDVAAKALDVTVSPLASFRSSSHERINDVHASRLP